MKLSFIEAISIKNSDKKASCLASLYSVSPQTIRKNKKATWKELITLYTDSKNDNYNMIENAVYKDGYFYVTMNDNSGIYSGLTLMVREAFLLSDIFQPTFPTMTTKSKTACLYRIFKLNGGKNIKIVPLGSDGLLTKFIAVVDGNRYYWEQIITIIEKSLY